MPSYNFGGGSIKSIMAILNYTTQIDTYKTISEIQKLLVTKGAASINVDYDKAGNPASLTFFMMINESPINFRLPSNWYGVRRVLEKDRKVPNKLKTDEQAMRVSWRITKDWVEAQMAIIEAGLAELPEVFLPYAVTSSGATLFQHIKGDMKLLTEANRQ